MATLQVKIDPSNAINGARVIRREIEWVESAANDMEKAVDAAAASTGKIGGGSAIGGARNVKRSMDDIAKSATTAGNNVTRFTGSANDNFARLNSQVNGVAGTFRTLISVLGPIAGLFSVNALVQYADAWSDMQSRVGAAIRDMEAAPEMMKRLVDIANASYAPLSQTVEIYSRNVSVLADLGRGANEAADFTEALNHALVLTATRGERAASVQNALSKAMATGKLEADGLESVLNNGGEVARALADELNTTVNGLRKMASDGKITGDVIASALIGRLDDLRERAGEMPATVGDAFVRIGTNLTALIGQMDQATGASGAIADALITFADNLDRVATYAGTAAVGFGTYYVAAMVAANASTLTLAGSLAFLRGAMMRTGFLVLVIAAGELVYQFMELVQAAGGFGNAMSLLADVGVEAWERIKLGGGSLLAGLQGIFYQIQGAWLTVIQVLQNAWAGFLNAVVGGLAYLPTFVPGVETAIDAVAGAAENASKKVEGTADAIAEANARSMELAQTSADLKAKITAPMESIARIREVMAEAANRTKNASDAAANLNGALSRVTPAANGAAGGMKKAGGAAKAAAQEFENFKQKADSLAEKMFPGEYARREAEELLALLTQFGSKLDELQRKAVEAEIADLFKASALGVRNLSDEAKKAGKEMENSFEPLASLLGDLFSGPIEDLDELVDKVMGAFAQIGQANLKKLTDGLFGTSSGEGTEAQTINQLGKSIGKAAAPALAETVAPAAGEGVFAGLQSFLGGQGGAMLSAGIGGFGMGYQTQSPAMGALGGALQGAGAGMAFGPVGMIAGALIGGLAGAIGGIFGKSKAQREAKKELMKQQGSIDNLLAIGEGTGVGTYTAQLREYKDENEKAQELAAKAGDVDLQRRLQAAYNTYFTRTFEDFNRNFDGLAKSLNDGLGANSPFMQAATEVTELRESLLGFIADAKDMNEQHIKLAGLEEGDPAFEVMEQQIERMTAGARAMALAALSGAEEYTEIEAAVERAHGAVAGLQNTLELLGMSAEEAARAIESHLNIAMAKMRDAYRDELNASINDKSGFGFINEIVDAHKLYEDRLKDAKVLGLDGSLALKELNLSLRNIVSSSSLTQGEIDMLAAAWPAMAGLIEAVAGKDAMAMVAEAESALRAAYEKQKSEIETTINRLERFTDTIKRFREEMRVNATSPLSQREQMEEALKLYRETTAAAMSGDQEAQEKLTSVSQSALDEARAYYASSEEYAKIWREIDTTLELVERSAGRQLTEAQQQLEALNAQVGALIDINESVLSVEAAIAALANATSARDRQMQDQINAAKGSGVESKNAQIAEMYRSILGRSGRDDEIAWWANSGKSIGTIRADIEWQKNVLGSFQSGGYTGNLGVSDIAGLVHGQEFVMPAAQTKAYMPDLSAMYAGTYRAGNDNGALIAAVGRLERRLEEQNSEIKSLRATVAIGAQATVGAVEKGNNELSEVADQLKRANAS